MSRWIKKSAPMDSDYVEIVYLKPEARLRGQDHFQFLDYETIEDATWGLQNETFVPLLGRGVIRSSDVVELHEGYWHTFAKREAVQGG